MSKEKNIEKEKKQETKKGNNKKFIILGVSAHWDQSMPKFQDFMKLAEKLDKDILIYMVGHVLSNFDFSCLKKKTSLSIIGGMVSIYFICFIYNIFYITLGKN